MPRPPLPEANTTSGNGPLPAGKGPFPLVVFASGNGGRGMAWVRDATQNRSWTQEQFLAAGYAVAWLRYRAEVDYAYHKIGKLIADRRQRRQLLNRGPLADQL